MSPPVAPTRHVISPGGILVSDLIADCLGVDAGRGIELMRFGGVYLNKKRLREDKMTTVGEYLRIHPQPRRFPAEGISWAERVVKETEEYVVVNKPAGIPAHATCDNLIENVSHGLGAHIGVPLKTTHRLDIGTQGLLVFGKTATFQSRFNGWLLKRLVQKKYRALVSEKLPLGEVNHYMGPGDRAPRILSAEPREGWKHCALSIDSVTEVAGGFETAITLMTGRTHQIRCQLSALGAPILGDDVYGSRLPSPPNIGVGEAFALQAYWLSFPGEEGFSLPAPW